MKNKAQEKNDTEEVPKNYCVFALVFARIVKREFELLFPRQDISITTCCILCALREYGQLSQTELAHHIMMDHATITRTVNLLEKKELVNRLKRTDDKRAYVVTLTTKGKRLHTKCMKVMDKLSEDISEPLATNDVEHLQAYLEKMVTFQKEKIFQSNVKTSSVVAEM